MNSPNTSDSSWNHAGGPNAPATDVTDETASMDPGSTLPQETRLRGIDIHPRETQESALARPAQIHPTCFAPTRVMSPSTMMGALGNDQANSVNEINTSLLLGQHLCQVCSNIGPDMMVCAECGTVGHPQCLKMSPLEGYWFCDNCYGVIQQMHDKWWAEQKAYEWRMHIRNQLSGWKKMAFEALSASTSVGIALGSAAVVAAGAATALTRGIKQGVANSSAGNQQISPELLIDDQRGPDSCDTSIVDSRRRVASIFGMLPDESFKAANPPAEIEDYCFKCERKVGKHTYGKNCRGIPFSAYQQRRSRQTVQSDPSSSTGRPQTASEVLPPPSLPPQLPGESPDEHLNRLLTEKLEREKAESQPIPHTPGGTGVLLCPPDSFGSARSHGLRSELVSVNNTQPSPRAAQPSGGEESQDTSPMVTLQAQLQEVMSSNTDRRQLDVDRTMVDKNINLPSTQNGSPKARLGRNSTCTH